MSGPTFKQLYMDVIWWADELTPTQKLVALAHASFAHHTGANVFPGKAAVAKRTGQGESTVERARRELVKAGWLFEVVKGGSERGGRRMQSSFRLAIRGATTIGAASTPLAAMEYPHRSGVPNPGSNPGINPPGDHHQSDGGRDCIDCLGNTYVIGADDVAWPCPTCRPDDHEEARSLAS